MLTSKLYGEGLSTAKASRRRAEPNRELWYVKTGNVRGMWQAGQARKRNPDPFIVKGTGPRSLYANSK